jgi:hypothetical protein
VRLPGLAWPRLFILDIAPWFWQSKSGEDATVSGLGPVHRSGGVIWQQVKMQADI